MGMLSKRRRPYVRPTPKVLFYFAIDMAGLFLFGAGAIYLTRGQSVVRGSFPSTTAEATLSVVVGIATMVWGAAHMLREMAKQLPPDAAPDTSIQTAPDPDRPAASEKDKQR